jgi:hypothetical protein
MVMLVKHGPLKLKAAINTFHFHFGIMIAKPSFMEWYGNQYLHFQFTVFGVAFKRKSYVDVVVHKTTKRPRIYQHGGFKDFLIPPRVVRFL